MIEFRRALRGHVLLVFELVLTSWSPKLQETLEKSKGRADSSFPNPSTTSNLSSKSGRCFRRNSLSLSGSFFDLRSCEQLFLAEKRSIVCRSLVPTPSLPLSLFPLSLDLLTPPFKSPNCAGRIPYYTLTFKPRQRYKSLAFTCSFIIA